MGCFYINNLINAFPPDCMHLVDLGVVLKMFRILIERKQFNKTKADEVVKRLKKFVPEEFPRKIRSFDDLDKFKASEGRILALYLAPVFLLECCENESALPHFLLFFVAYRLLMGKNGVIPEEDLHLADRLMRKFVLEFPHIYGRDKISFNVHCLLHLVHFARLYGPLHTFSAYKYENHYQLLRKWLRKSSHHFQQVYTRWWQTQGQVIRKQNIEFGSFLLRSNKKDSGVLLKDNRVGIIKKKSLTAAGFEFKVKLFKTYDYFFDYPIDSRELNIFCVKDLSEEEVVIKQSDIKTKMFLIPIAASFITVPILHC